MPVMAVTWVRHRHRHRHDKDKGEQREEEGRGTAAAGERSHGACLKRSIEAVDQIFGFSEQGRHEKQTGRRGGTHRSTDMTHIAIFETQCIISDQISQRAGMPPRKMNNIIHRLEGGKGERRS